MLINYGKEFNPRRKCLVIFNHLSKCGGTTFKNILKTHFSSKCDDAIFLDVNNLFSVIILHRLRKFLLNKKIILLSGHCTWKVEKVLLDYKERDIYYLTILREPWNRMISEVNFMCYKGFREVADFESFLRARKQYYTKWLGDDNLDLAKQNLQKSYYLFGLVEKYEDFLRLFGYYFGNNNIIYSKRNVLKDFSQNTEEKFFSKYKDMFYKINSQDIELYHWAKALFDNRLKRISHKIQMINIDCIGLDKAPKGSGGFLQYKRKHILEKEELLKEQIQKDPCSMNTLIYRFYDEYELWEKYVGAAESLIDLFKKELKDIQFANDAIVIKQLTNLLSGKEKILSQKKIDVKEVERQIIFFNEFWSNLLKQVVHRYKLTLRNKFPFKDFYLFCKNTVYQKIGFYGISSCFMLHYDAINRYLNNCEIFLFDSDKNKHGKKIDTLIINPPEKIVDIKPEIIIITSAFYYEIFSYLTELKKINKLSFRIARLENHFYQYL